MLHHTPLVATVASGIGLAFVLGVAAHRLRISPLVGYILAGVVVGPFTPGFVADQALAGELAEIGIILLMFGVGLHFSVGDLLSVRWTALPGAAAEMALITLTGMGLALLIGWPPATGLVFGLCLSVASTVVLLRALQERRLVQTGRGRIAVGWLVVEDLAMVLVLVLLPVLPQAAGQAPGGGAGGSGGAGAWLAAGLMLGKVSLFVAVMVVVGKRVIPLVLHYVAHTGSRELFRLAVLAIALGVAFGAAGLFGVSFALGAFLAGVVLSESELSQRAAAETLPLRDAFAVLFFVSVGMLFNPAVLLEQPWALLGTLGIVVVAKPVAAALLLRLLGHPGTTAATVAAGLAQIGEFSFILAGLGVSLKLLPEAGRDLVLAASILSIVLNPVVFAALGRFVPAQVAGPVPADAAAPPAPAPAVAPPETDLVPTALTRHSVVVGYGRVGQALTAGLLASGHALLVIEDQQGVAGKARAGGIETLVGNAAVPAVLRAAGVAAAEHLFVAIPDAFEAGQIVEQARRANLALDIVARAHSDEEVEHLKRLGASGIVMGERELARGMLDHALQPEAFPAAAAAADGDAPQLGPRASVA